jgi:DNA-binding NtrC family response regulator
LADILEAEGCEVATAYDGFKALESVKQSGFDLVFIDIKMPVMNGVETFKKMKEIVPGIPVIMMSAYAVEELIREALQEQAFGFLKKPVDFEKLYKLVEQATAKGGLILVVDDDQEFCANINNILTDKGYRVSTAHDGDMAIEKVWENNFDIILLDMKLPPLNGLETYLAIREVRRNVAVVVITGYLEEMGDLVQKALHESAYVCMEKPVNMDGLISLLDKIREQKGKAALPRL